MAELAPARRRFQFRLRTLMIVVTLLAVPCAYVGWQAKIVRERRALFDEIKAADGGELNDGNVSPSPPWLRRILGDETVRLLVVPSTTDKETMVRLHRLFPGTLIWFGDRTLALSPLMRHPGNAINALRRKIDQRT